MADTAGTAERTVPEAAVDAAARALHQHGPTRSGAQTERWQDCPHANVHGGAAAEVVTALLADPEARAALLDAWGIRTCEHIEAGELIAVAERDRYREALDTIAHGRAFLNYDPGSPRAMDATQYGWSLAARIAREALETAGGGQQ